MNPGPSFGLAATIRLRRESFGGIAFHRGNGRLLDLDREAFELACALGAEGPIALRDLAAVLRRSLGRPVPASRVAHMVAELAARDFVEEGKGARISPCGVSAETLPGRLGAPVGVHWALTYECNLDCPSCYAPSPVTADELTLREKLRAIERLAAWGVLEVALGGGEPTISRHLDPVLRAIRGCGMAPSLTTNGFAVVPRLARLLARTCGVVQVSLDRPEVLDLYRGRGAAGRALDALRRLKEGGARVGTNLLLVPENIASIGRSLDWLVGRGVDRIVLLRPLGCLSGRWPAGWPPAGDWGRLEEDLKAWTRGRPPADLEVACGLAFLLKGLTWKERRRRLAFGCSGGDRFAGMSADGTLWPCSHLRSEAHRMGHVLRDDLAGMWRRARRRAAGSLACPAAVGR